MPVQPSDSKKVLRPAIALLLSVFSTFFCCISFVVNDPNGFDAYINNSPLWYVAQALMCLASLSALAGIILGIISLRAKGDNRGVSIASLVIGVPAFILVLLIFGYVMVFVGVIRIFSP